jgi:hypothetical protein
MKIKLLAIGLTFSTFSTLFSVLPAFAGKSWYYVLGDKVAKVGDVTDKNSDARRILRNVDITNPNSPACNSLRNGGDDAANMATKSGTAQGAAIGQGITLAKKVCGNPPKTQADIDAAEQSILAVAQVQLQIEQARIDGDVKKTQILEDAKVKITQLQESGQTERTRIVEENALKIALSQDATEIREAELHLEEIQSNNWAAVEMNHDNNTTEVKTTVIKGGVDLVKTLFQTGSEKREQKRKEKESEDQVRIAQINAETDRLRIAADLQAKQIAVNTQPQQPYYPQQPVYPQQGNIPISYPVANGQVFLPYYAKVIGQLYAPVSTNDVNMLSNVMSQLEGKPQPTSCQANPASYVTYKYGGVFALCAAPDNFHAPGSSYKVQ